MLMKGPYKTMQTGCAPLSPFVVRWGVWILGLSLTLLRRTQLGLVFLPSARLSRAPGFSCLSFFHTFQWSRKGPQIKCRGGAGMNYQFIMEFLFKVMKKTWLLPPDRTEAKNTCRRRNGCHYTHAKEKTVTIYIQFLLLYLT